MAKKAKTLEALANEAGITSEKFQAYEIASQKNNYTAFDELAKKAAAEGWAASKLCKLILTSSDQFDPKTMSKRGLETYVRRLYKNTKTA